MEHINDLDNRSGDVVDRLHEDLRRDLAELVTSEDWREALAVAARFHDYSFSNTRLICVQAAARGFVPTRVAGYRTWRELGRQVRRGEKGSAILAPTVRLVELDDGAEERRVVGFRPVHVFDISATEGRPFPRWRRSCWTATSPNVGITLLSRSRLATTLGGSRVRAVADR